MKRYLLLMLTTLGLAAMASPGSGTVELAGVRWHSWEDAQGRARREGKPILLFDMVGRLDERWC